jgi:hypothetical protein
MRINDVDRKLLKHCFFANILLTLNVDETETSRNRKLEFERQLRKTDLSQKY